MSAEATQLRDLLGLSERETWMDKEDEAVIADAGETQTQTHSFTYSFFFRAAHYPLGTLQIWLKT